MKKAYKISALENNIGLICYLMVAILKKKTLLVDQKYNKNKRFQNLQAE